MSMLGLALTATLSFAPPDASTDAPIVIVAPPAATAAPVVVVPSPAPAPVLPPPPPPPPPIPRKPLAGIGLMAAGTSVFLIGLGAQLSAFDSQSRYCSNWAGNGYNTVHGCFYDTEPWMVHMGTGYAFGSSLVMTSIGAGALGQYHAWNTVFAHARERNPRAPIIAGGFFASLGIGAAIAEGFLLRRELNDFCTTHECEVQRRAMYYTLADVGAASFIAGVSMMSYGSNYRRNRFRYGKNWSLVPTGSPTTLGASATFRF